MDIGRPTTTTEPRALVRVVNYYWDMWPSQSHIIYPLAEADSVPKGGRILCNDGLEESFK